MNADLEVRAPEEHERLGALPAMRLRVVSATPGEFLAEGLADCSGRVYVAPMDATLTSIGERTASAAGGVCLGLSFVAAGFDIIQSG
jgi:hypothetical protein